MSESDPIPFRPRPAVTPSPPAGPPNSTIVFDRRELNQILNVYGRMVAAGEWRDYAMDFGREAARFAVFKRAADVPLYTIEKNPKLARRQGAYAVVNAAGMILKRGHDLARVLDVFEQRNLQVVR